jgi:hypothetical protein
MTNSPICSECPAEDVYAHGRCRRCYQRWYMSERRRDAKPYLRTWDSAKPGNKVCRSCELELPRDQFAARHNGKDGLASWCRDCTNKRARARRSADPHARAKEREYEQRIGRHTKRRYGIPREQWEARIKAQGGLCIVCGRLPRKRLVGDHCHTTGKFRGIVCDNCNVSMGLANEDPKLLRKLADWIEQGGEPPQ